MNPPLLPQVLKAALTRLASKGYNYQGRKVYTLAEFDWSSTYGFGEGGSAPQREPAGIYMIEGSPCRGVLVIRRIQGGWLVHFINSHTRRKFEIPDGEMEVSK